LQTRHQPQHEPPRQGKDVKEIINNFLDLRRNFCSHTGFNSPLPGSVTAWMRKIGNYRRAETALKASQIHTGKGGFMQR